MDEIEKLIEKYRMELIEFSKSCPCADSYGEAGGETDDNTELTEKAEDEASVPVSSEIIPVRNTADNISEENYTAPEFDSYEDFIKGNPQSGSLKFQIYAADMAFPVQSARVTVVLELKNESREIFDGLTDINGIIDSITLPAPDKDNSQSPQQSSALPYSSYTAYIEHPEFVRIKITNIPIFSGIKTIQNTEMVPLVGAGTEPARIEENDGEAFLRLKGDE